MSGERPHWAVYALASAMGLVFFAFVALFVASEWSAAEKAEWRWGFVDVDGRTVVPIGFEGARGFHDGRAAAKKDGLWGFVDRTGAWVVEPRFRQLCDYARDELTCAQAERWGYIDDTGAWAIEPEHAAAMRMERGVGAVGAVVGTRTTRISGSTSQSVVHFGLIGRDGTWITPILPDRDPKAWTSVGSWSEGKLAVQIGGDKYGYVDPTGAMVLDPFFRSAQPFHNGFAAVSGGGGWAVIDAEGNLVVDEAHGIAGGAAEGLIAGPTGYHALDGEPIGPRFEWVRPHNEGLGAVMDRGLWGFVDGNVEIVVSQQFVRVSDFADGRALAAVVDGLNFRWGIIDRTGAWVVEPRWRGVDESGFHEGLLAVSDGESR